MKYPLSEKYNNKTINDRIMGPNPIKLEEELLRSSKIKPGEKVMDLGSGQGVTSLFMAKEYGYRVYACDLWSSPEENQKFFSEMGIGEERIKACKADANDLPFEHDFFDAIVSTDSYNYFGRDPDFLGSKLVPFVRRGGYIYIAIPGMKQDCHDNLPPELLLSWTPEQMEYMHDTAYWTRMVSMCPDVEVLDVYEMESNDEVWADWLAQDNEYAVGDRKSMDAGAGKYLNFIAIILRRK